MSPSNFFTLILVFLVSIWLFLFRKRDLRLPPGPRGLPIIGCLHLLGKLPHLNLHNLSKKYGPIMSMQLGSVTTIVVSSPQAAELFLKTHDIVFADRPSKLQFSKYLSYGEKGLAFTPYGPYWRSVRKFCALELLSAKKIESFAGMRRGELVLLVNKIKKATLGREVVNISDMVNDLMGNMACRMLFGRSHDDRFDLTGLINDIVIRSNALNNIADYAAFLGPLDLQGITGCLKATRTLVDKVFDVIIREQEVIIANSREKEHDTNFLGALLSLMDKPTDTHAVLARTISREHIKAIMVDIIGGGIATSKTAIEWIMTELIRNPRIMKKIQDEIMTYIGVSEIVEEKYLTKFNYLDLVIKENFRLHPTIPLNPRESINDVVVNGYNIPKGSRILVNNWAIGRDSNAWSENIEKFIPERFIGKNIDFKGQDFMFIPFGSGRRLCPGMQLGLINVQLIVAQLVHSFDWELPNGMLVDDLNMEEKVGITMPRKHGLCAIPSFRL